jgi:hypothetical protein
MGGHLICQIQYDVNYRIQRADRDTMVIRSCDLQTVSHQSRDRRPFSRTTPPHWFAPKLGTVNIRLSCMSHFIMVLPRDHRITAGLKENRSKTADSFSGPGDANSIRLSFNTTVVEHFVHLIYRLFNASPLSHATHTIASSRIW